MDKEVERIGKAEPNRLQYLLSFSYGHPGNLRLTYYRHGLVMHEYAELRPDGILYDQRIFRKVESFLNYFKQNFKQIVGISVMEKD